MDGTDRILDALMTSGDCVEIISLDGRVTHHNRGTEHCGDAAADSSLWVSQWPEASRSAVLMGLERAVEGEPARFTAYRPKDGEDAWWDVSVSPIRNSQSVSEILALSRNVTEVVDAIRDRTREADEATRLASERDLVAREMRHRLKNQITAVESLARMTARACERTEDFIPAFSQRLMRLSIAQDLLAVRNYEPVELDRAVHATLAAAAESGQMEIGELPTILVLSSSLTTLTLILGELLTNSLKYGALRHGDGRIRLECAEHPNALTFTWREDVGAPLLPGVEGNGQRFMRRMSAISGIPFTVDWQETGLTCTFGLVPGKGSGD